MGKMTDFGYELDEEETELENALEAGGYVSVENIEEMKAKIMLAAANTMELLRAGKHPSQNLNLPLTNRSTRIV
jgi:hypothetical protein